MNKPYTFFVRVPNAQQVNVIGEFNNWQSTAHALERIGDDLWQLTLELPAGRYRYAFFVINNDWEKAASGRTRIVGQGSWAHVTSESWINAQHPIQLSPTMQQLSAA